MIEAIGVLKRFGRLTALDNASLNVSKGSVYGLVGPNGSGKTTIIKHLAGVLKQDKGTVRIGGNEVYENPKAKARIFYIPDELYFFAQYSVTDLAKFYSGFYPKWDWGRFHALKPMFDIEPDKRIVKLSRGMQKQVAFWMAISSSAEALILDEPVDGLDPVMRRKVWSLVLQDVAERQTSILVSSHNLRELEDVCDCVGIMHRGKIILQRELDALKSDIHKIQAVFEADSSLINTKKLELLKIEKSGSVYRLIARGDKDSIISAIKLDRPVVIDILPLSLEEIFVYELGGLGYDIQSVVI